MGAALQVTSSTFEAEVLQASELTITDFWAEWCLPCKRIAPILDEIAAEYHDQVKVAKVDVDAYPEIAEEYGITGIPTLLLFKNGSLVDSVVGFVPKDRLLDKVSRHL